MSCELIDNSGGRRTAVGLQKKKKKKIYMRPVCIKSLSGHTAVKLTHQSAGQLSCEINLKELNKNWQHRLLSHGSGEYIL